MRERADSDLRNNGREDDRKRQSPHFLFPVKVKNRNGRDKPVGKQKRNMNESKLQNKGM